MDDSGILAEAGAPGSLNQEYQLEDFDPTVELETGALDFGLDGSYEQEGHVLAEEIDDDTAALDFEPQPSDAEEETHAEAADDKDAEAGEDAATTGDKDVEAATGPEHTSNDDNVTGVEVEDQDEIGYEDDDLVTTEVNADLSTTETGAAEVKSSNVPSGGSSESAQLADDGHADFSMHENDASSQQENGSEDHDPSANPQDEHSNAEEQDADGDVEGNVLTDDNFDDQAASEHHDADRHDDDLDNALEDLSQSLAAVHDLEVVYNQECYSLFGHSDDDPDSFFLSDVNELDRPLSEFLSALRAVISDELAPTDELVIRFDPLELEFGERSNEKFLNRSFREVLDCHATLSQVPGTSADPVIQLMVRRDSEEHFLELLADAERVKASSNGPEDSEMSENLDDEPAANASDDGEMQNQPTKRDDSDEVHDEAEYVVTEEHAEDEDEHELQIHPSEDDVAGEEEQEQEQDAEAGDALQSSDVNADTSGTGEHSEETSGEVPEHDAGDEHVWHEHATELVAATPHAEISSAEVSDEQIHELTDQQQSDEFIETKDLDVADDDATHDNGELEQAADANDDDLILAFHDEADFDANLDTDVPTTHEDVEEHEEYTITYDESENLADDAEGTHEPSDDAVNQQTSSDLENGHAAAIAETTSIHTSTTINGDEIDYEEEIVVEQNAADDLSTPANDGAEQSEAASGIDHDEIDWENDEDEYEQQPASADSGVDSSESKEAAQSPPSIAGKRRRTDEAESLAEETDHKRRRT